MTFLNALTGPQWALALLIPLAVTALYFLRLRRKQLEVPSTFLWRKSIEDLHVNTFWQRLRRNILLLLQLLLIAAVLLALTRPAWNVETTGNRLILLIDQSASMSATDVAPSRLEVAKTKALGIVEQMKPGDAALVIAFADSARVMATYTEDTSILRRAITAIEPTTRPTDLREALSIASGLANPERILEDPTDADVTPIDLAPARGMEATAYLFSDGRFPEVLDFPLGNLNLRYLKIGAARDNVGIMNLAARSKEDGSNGTEIFARLRNFGVSPVQRAVELLVNDERFDLRRVDIPAQGEAAVTFQGPAEPTAKIIAQLQEKDNLAIDDQAFLVLAPPAPARLLRYGPPNPVLDAVLETPALKQLVESTSRPASDVDLPLEEGNEKSPIDLVIYDRCRPKEEPPANAWYIGQSPATELAKTKDARGPLILSWNTTHPVLRFLNLDDVAFFEAKVSTDLEKGSPLIETDQGTILWSRARGVFTDLVLVSPLVDDKGDWQTDWPLKPSFPLFVMNVIRTLGRVEAENKQNVTVASTATLRLRGHEKEGVWRSPKGTEQTLRAETPGRFELPALEDVGFHQFTAGDQTRWISVNLANERESTIEPMEKVSVGAETTSDSSAAYQVRREGWKGLVVAALGLLALEWYIYNRRVHV